MVVAKSSFELKFVPVERTREKTDWFTTGLGVPQSHLIPSWEHISLVDFLQQLGFERSNYADLVIITLL